MIHEETKTGKSDEQGGLGEELLDRIAEKTRNDTIVQAKATLTNLIAAIDGTNVVTAKALQMIASYCNSVLDLLTTVSPGLVSTGKRNGPSFNVGTPYQLSTGGVMANNETFGASILEQAVAAIGPMIQSRRVKDLTSALAEAKDSDLGPGIVADLEGSVRDALGIEAPRAADTPAVMDGVSAFPVED
jgi:hypothetical protein